MVTPSTPSLDRSVKYPDTMLDQPTPVRPPKQEQQPASEDIVEVAEGILRLQLPIDMPGLGHVNTYALEDADGFTLVDPGLPGKANWDALLDRMKRAGIPLARVHGVVVTHSHPDHFGGAGLLAEEAGAAIIASDRFRTMWDPSETWQDEELDSRSPEDPPLDPAQHVERIVRVMSGETHDEDGRPLPPSPFGGPTPWGGARPSIPPERRAEMRANLTEYLRWFRMPRPSVRLADDEVLKLAGREWFAVFTPGHTDDHLCLWDPTEGILLAGDHVLPTITPHISGLGEGDTLAAYLDSLDKVAALPGIRLALPAHGGPVTDVPKRVTEIRAHHGERLDQLVEISDRLGWASVEDLSHEMFRPRSWGSMAESEAYAHIEHLRLQGRAERRDGTAGVPEYRVG
jgi:glyoxylase-like metal-dependent hydrolase (beta-lactamase superfamily II)